MSLRRWRFGLVVFACLLAGRTDAQALVPAAPPAATAPAASDDVEEVADAVEVKTTDVTADPGQPGLLDLIGRFHAAFVHFPIAWLLMVLLIDIGTFAGRREAWRAWGLWALIGAVASCVPAILSGLLRQGRMAPGPDLAALIQVHRTIMMLMGSAAVAALAIRLARRNALDGASKGAYLSLVVVATVLAMVGGHWGGKIVYGKAFLPF